MAVLTLGEDGLISICADIFTSPCEHWPPDNHQCRAEGLRAALLGRICQERGWKLAETGNAWWPLLKKLIIIQHLRDWAINLISTPHTQALLSLSFQKKKKKLFQKAKGCFSSALLAPSTLRTAPKRQLGNLQSNAGGKQGHKSCAQLEDKLITKEYAQVSLTLGTAIIVSVSQKDPAIKSVVYFRFSI